jgi:hypothetical protein
MKYVIDEKWRKIGGRIFLDEEQLYFGGDIFPIEKGKREFSSLDPAGDFWRLWTIQCTTMGFRITAPIRFARHKPLRFLVLWIVERSHESHESNSSDEIEEENKKIWDEPTFDDVQGVFHNWMSRPAWVIENERENIIG